MHPEIFKVQHSRLIEFLRTHLDGHFPVILDAGSGDGFMLSVIKTAGTPTYDRFLMLDISVNMLRIAKERHPEAITVRSLRRVIASIRGIRNPAYSRINSILMP